MFVLQLYQLLMVVQDLLVFFSGVFCQLFSKYQLDCLLGLSISVNLGFYVLSPSSWLRFSLIRLIGIALHRSTIVNLKIKLGN